MQEEPTIITLLILPTNQYEVVAKMEKAISTLQIVDVIDDEDDLLGWNNSSLTKLKIHQDTSIRKPKEDNSIKDI